MIKKLRDWHNSGEYDSDVDPKKIETILKIYFSSSKLGTQKLRTIVSSNLGKLQDPYAIYHGDNLFRVSRVELPKLISCLLGFTGIISQLQIQHIIDQARKELGHLKLDYETFKENAPYSEVPLVTPGVELSKRTLDTAFTDMEPYHLMVNQNGLRRKTLFERLKDQHGSAYTMENEERNYGPAETEEGSRKRHNDDSDSDEEPQKMSPLELDAYNQKHG